MVGIIEPERISSSTYVPWKIATPRYAARSGNHVVRYFDFGLAAQAFELACRVVPRDTLMGVNRLAAMIYGESEQVLLHGMTLIVGGF